jgi:hypothetical protein
MRGGLHDRLRNDYFVALDAYREAIAVEIDAVEDPRLAASWFEAGGTIAGAAVASLVAVFVWKTWQSTKRQLAEAERQTQAARQQARSAKQQLALERDRDEQRFDMTRREQADQVSAWLVRGISVNKDLTNIHVVNSGSQPVYRLALYVQIGLDLSTHERFRRSMLGPTPLAWWSPSLPASISSSVIEWMRRRPAIWSVSVIH